MDVLADWNTQDSPFHVNQWRARRRARQQEQRERQRLLWGGPVDANRVLAFSDAVFAIAITLLTLRLEVPSNLQGSALARELRDLLPAIGAYTLSFVILGRLWLTHHRIFAVVAPRRPVRAGPQPHLSRLHRRHAVPGAAAQRLPRPAAGDRCVRAHVHRRHAAAGVVVDLGDRPGAARAAARAVPDEIRTGFTRTIAGLLLVFGAVVRW
jgi:hypothetical protein